MQAAYYVDILVITLLHNNAGSVLCRYLGHYFAAQYCCTILQSAYYLHFLVITLLHNTVAAYYVDILVITLLHNNAGSVLCRYLGHYFAAQYCCTILQAAYYLHFLVITLLYNTVAAYYVDILVITFLYNIVASVLCRYLSHYFAAQYCWQRTTCMLICWSLLCCTILQTAYYVDMLVISLLYNIVGSVQCRYVGRYFAAKYCRQRTMQISWSLLCCTILQAAYYVDMLVVTLLHITVGSVLCRYLGRYFAAQYCRQSTMQISQ